MKQGDQASPGTEVYRGGEKDGWAFGGLTGRQIRLKAREICEARGIDPDAVSTDYVDGRRSVWIDYWFEAARQLKAAA